MRTRIRRFAGFLRRHPVSRWGLPVLMLAVVAVLPVPWLQATTPNPPGIAWRLDGRFLYNGEAIDPSGTWYALSAGRPPIVAEVVLSWIDKDVPPPRNMTQGSTFSSPAMAEPAAIAIGLAHAGRDIVLTTLFEVSEPSIPGLPERAQIISLNGQVISSSEDWSTAVAHLGHENRMTMRNGAVHTFSGDEFPYRQVVTMGFPIDASVDLAGWLGIIPESWYRNLTLGRSHGLILALAAYAHSTGDDLAAGRVIAGTGTIRVDGTVGPIGGLAAKARAAHGVGAEIFVYPEGQRCQGEAIAEDLLDTNMTMFPVATLDDAIGALRGADMPPPKTDCP